MFVYMSAKVAVSVLSRSVFTEMDAPFNVTRRKKAFWNGTMLAYSLLFTQTHVAL